MLEYVDLLHGVLRYSHVAAGFLGLALFWVPVFAVKGSPLHIRCGRWFVWIAYYVGATALVSAVWCLCHPTSFIGAAWDTIGSKGRPYVLEQLQFMFSILGYLALAILCGAVFGVRVVRTRHDHALLRSPWLLGLEGAFGLWSLGLVLFGAWNLAMIYSGRHLLPVEAAGRYWIPVALGLFGMFGVKGDIAYILKPRPTPMAWWYKHMENMLGVGIGFHTAFLVFGLSRFLPIRLDGAWQLVPWLLPAAIGVPATYLWIRYYQRKFGELETPPAAKSSSPDPLPLL